MIAIGESVSVVVPIVPEHDWAKCLDFARAMAFLIVERDPARYTADFRKAGREDKVLVDYLRNNRTNTSICAFAVRARDGAPVSMPVAWADLKVSLRPERFTVISGRQLVKRRDPWKDYWRTGQRLKLFS